MRSTAWRAVRSAARCRAGRSSRTIFPAARRSAGASRAAAFDTARANRLAASSSSSEPLAISRYKVAGRMTLFTIGHSTRSLDELVGLLREQAVALLADVRTAPGSRRMPHFSRQSLAGELPRQGIEYS